MKANPVKGGGGAKAPVKKTLQSMREAAKKMPVKTSGSGTPTRATATTAPRRPRDVGTPYVAERKSPRGSADTTRYGRATGTPYKPKSKPVSKSALPKTK
jgi:hypothetical protein